jgi:hypothetical protein
MENLENPEKSRERLKKMKMKKITIISLALFVISSCMTTKTPVGKFNEQVGKEYKYAKGKQLWLFWGILPLGRTNVNTPSDGNCMVITRFNFTDILVSSLTAGIITTQTIKIKAKRNEEQQVNGRTTSGE